MKKLVLSGVAVASLVLAANAVTYMRVKTADGQVVKYDVEKVVEVDFEEDSSTPSDSSMNQGVTVSGTVDDYTYVDLGLSVKWATYNVGATKPTEYGDYFAWGETKPKKEYSWATYKWGTADTEGDLDKLTKYNENSGYGTVDNKTVLEAADDAATANWGSAWRMPTEEEQIELYKGCTWKWVADFNGSGIAGQLGTSKANGNTIFLPAAGIDSTGLYGVASSGYYWSSSVVISYCALHLSFEDVGSTSLWWAGRSCGQSVRAVSCCYTYSVNFYGSDSTLISSQEIKAGKSASKVEAPAIDGYEFSGWSDSSFVKVTKDLNIYAKYTKKEGGTQDVTVSGTVGDYTYVDLGLSVKWATYNVGATKPTEFGDYFAWGETKPKDDYSGNTYKWGSANSKGDLDELIKYNTDSWRGTVDSLMVLESADDAATANWGSAWRMPTSAEQDELRDGCDWVWVEDFKGSGVNGRLGTSKANGNTIFLPAAGVRGGTDLLNAGNCGGFWSSSLYENYSVSAYDYSYSSIQDWYNSDRSDGKSVRAVVKGNTYTVNFYGSDSTLISSQVVEEGSAASSVDAPEIAGYEFSGWSDSSFVKVTKDLNIYAKYTKNAVTDQGVTVSGTVGDYTYVDLGLSVKWATYNVGATKPTEFGDYFAWGETTPKEEYEWSNYKWCKNKKLDSYIPQDFTKYNTKSSYGTVDSLTVLEAADDAATANWGSAWRMPTLDEIGELFVGCDWEWVEDFNGSGMDGNLGTSKSNGNTIFLPAAGIRRGTALTFPGYGHYWSSSLIESSPYEAYDHYVDGYNVSGDRLDGRSVRAVTK